MIEDSSPDSPTPANRANGQRYRFSHDQSVDDSLSVSIIRAIASVSEVDPLSLQPRLYDVIDSDALETLVCSESTDSRVQITFQFERYEVTVKQSGAIIVQDGTSVSGTE